jgi:dienelactone hydrolase
MRISRRHLLQTVAAVPLAGAVPAQTKYPGVAYRDYPRCLPDYLRQLAASVYEKRNRELAKLGTVESVRKRQIWARDTFWRIVGGKPEPSPLNVRTVGGFERPGYKLEKLVYESFPGLHVPANLYIPTGAKPPFPGVLFQLGHSTNGKASEAYQKCCQGLARLGYLVLAFDPMGQGERTYYPSANSPLSRIGADEEHTVPGKQMLLLGDTSTRMQTWDAVRSLDVLAAHPLVDPKRLGSTGNSGGGTLTMLLSTVDDRLTAAAASCPNTENLACANFNPPGSTDDAEQDLLGGPDGFDRWDLFYPFAPKPLLVLVSAKDFFGTYSPRYISSGWEEFQKLQRAYTALGKADRIKWTDTPLPHGLSYYPRMQVYNWFAKWLKGEAQPVKEEPPVAPEKDETLWVTPTASIVRTFGSKTPFGINRERAGRIQTPGDSRNLKKLLGLEMPPAGARATVMGKVPSVGCEAVAIEVPSAPKVWVPAWIFQPVKADGDKPVLVFLDPGGRNQRWGEDSLLQELARRGCVVCAPDLRGIGDLSPEFPRGSPRHGQPHQEEENYAWSSLMLGHSLVGQRTTDTLAIVAALRAMPDLAKRRLVLIASGKLTVPALFAAGFEKRIDSLYLAGGLISYRSIVETEDYNQPFANFVPEILLSTDLPNIARDIAPRPVVLAGPVDARSAPLDPEAAARYAGGNVKVLPKPVWSVETLMAL